MPKKNPDGQPEIVLENRHLLWVFFLVVALCGVFFALGYVVGRNTLNAVARVAQPASGAVEATSKPSPMPPAAYASPNPQTPPADASAEQPAPATDLDFYQSVEQAPDAKLAPAEPSETSSGGASQSAAEKQSPAPAPASNPAASASAPQGGVAPAIWVQISALTRREDANALVKLLKERNLPVLVTAGAADALFHVVVGPYKTLKDAESAKSILEQDGFRPIIKR